MAFGRLSLTPVTAKGIRKHSVGHAQKIPAAPDGGWGWVVCFACFLVHVFVDGLGYSFGIIFVELLNDFKHSKGTTSWIPSLATAMTSLSGLVVAPFTNRYGCRAVAVVGAIVTFIGMVLSYFAPNLYFLYFSYGILAGLGYGLLYFPSIICVSIYFDKRRAFATGLAVCGAGVGLLIFGPLTQYLIRLYAWRGAILIQAALILNCLACALVYHPVDGQDINTTQRCPERKQTKASISDEIIVESTIVSEYVCVDNEGFTPELDPGRVCGSTDATFARSSAPNGNAGQQKCVKGEHNDGNRNTTDEYQDTISSSNGQVGIPIYICQKCKPDKNVPAAHTNTNTVNSEISTIRPGRGSNHPETCANSQESDANSPETVTNNHQIETILTDTSNSKVINTNGHDMKATRTETAAKSFETDAEATGHPIRTDDRMIEASLHDSVTNYQKICINSLGIEANGMVSRTNDLKADPTGPATGNRTRVEAGVRAAEIDVTQDTVCVWMLRKISIVGAFNVNIMKNQVFCMVAASVLIHSVGFYIPYIYLPDRAKDAGIEELRRAWLLASVGITNTVSRVVFGYIADRNWVNRMVLYSTSMVICGLAIVLVPFLASFEALLVYSMVFGASGGVTIALMSVILADVVGIDQLTDAFGVTNFAAGSAILLGPPFAGWLYDMTGSYDASFIFGGSCVAAAGLMLYLIPCSEIRRKR